MVLTEKETAVIKDLQTQEQTCIEKYKRYSEEAKDPVLKDLFKELQQKEQTHYDSLEKVLNGTVPCCNCNDCEGKEYAPKATYSALGAEEDKKADCFLATDCIGTEKLVSSEYNTDVFAFGDPGVRKLLADIQIEEQNHAEMLYKYKTVNGMS
jgi:spore coat protein CotF